MTETLETIKALITTHTMVAAFFGLAIGFILRRSDSRSHNSRVNFEDFAENQRVEKTLRAQIDELREESAEMQASMIALPEIAQRLSATRSVPDIPPRAVDLIMEVFVPRYCTFFKLGKAGLVAAYSRGTGPYEVGDRILRADGPVGLAAVRQVPLDPAEVDSILAGRFVEREKHVDFSMCLPIVDGQRVFGVLLVGPTQRRLPRELQIGRTVAMLTAVTITHTLVLEEQERLANTDGLTGIFNRGAAMRKANEMLQNNTFQTISVFLFDIDHFKNYNDTNGHLAGDDVLRTLAGMLDEEVRDHEFVARYGGEEFMVIMPGAPKDVALQAAERMRELISDYQFPHEENQPLGDVTISGGVATWPFDGTDLTDVLQRADEALYAAKESGRNAVLAAGEDGPEQPLLEAIES